MLNARWYRLHWITWIVVLVIGGALVWYNVNGIRRARYFGSSGPWHVFHRGWPLVHSERLTRPETYPGPKVDEFPNVMPEWRTRLAFDVTWSLAGVATVAFLVERLSRSRLRFPVSALLGIPTIVAGLFWILPLEQKWQTPMANFHWSRAPTVWSSYPGLNWPLRTATIFTLASMLFALSWIAIFLLHRLTNRRYAKSKDVDRLDSRRD